MRLPASETVLHRALDERLPGGLFDLWRRSAPVACVK
jgi:hypothetical protein